MLYTDCTLWLPGGDVNPSRSGASERPDELREDSYAPVISPALTSPMAYCTYRGNISLLPPCLRFEQILPFSSNSSLPWLCTTATREHPLIQVAQLNVRRISGCIALLILLLGHLYMCKMFAVNVPNVLAMLCLRADEVYDDSHLFEETVGELLVAPSGTEHSLAVSGCGSRLSGIVRDDVSVETNHNNHPTILHSPHVKF